MQQSCEGVLAVSLRFAIPATGSKDPVPGCHSGNWHRCGQWGFAHPAPLHFAAGQPPALAIGSCRGGCVAPGVAGNKSHAPKIRAGSAARLAAPLALALALPALRLRGFDSSNPDRLNYVLHKVGAFSVEEALALYAELQMAISKTSLSFIDGKSSPMEATSSPALRKTRTPAIIKFSLAKNFIQAASAGSGKKKSPSFMHSFKNIYTACKSERVRRGAFSSNISSVQPLASLSSKNSTESRVPLMVGLPSKMSGSETM